MATSPLSRVTRSRLLQNVVALFVLQAGSWIVPLITLPYLTRVLEEEAFGAYVFAQSYGIVLIMLIEYGFSLSATREVARIFGRTDEDPGALGRIVADVVGAKVVLTVAVVAISILLGFAVPTFRDDPVLLWVTVGWAVVQGFHPGWFFTGIERLTRVANIELVTKFASMIAIFVLVRDPDDVTLVLASQAVGALASTVIASVLMYRIVPMVRLAWSSSIEGLRLGWTMFLYRSGELLYIAANGFILGLLSTNIAVGNFGAAERIGRGFSRVLSPVRDAIYPRLNNLRGGGTDGGVDEAAALTRIGLYAMAGVGAVASLAVFVTAPWLVELLAPDFRDSVTILRILAALPLLSALSAALGVQWLLPLGLDRSFNFSIYAGGAANLIAAITLAPRYGGVGMAVAVVIAELVIITGFLIALRRSGEL